MRAIDFTKKFIQENEKLSKHFPYVNIFLDKNDEGNMINNKYVYEPLCFPQIHISFVEKHQIKEIGSYAEQFIGCNELDKFNEIDKETLIDWSSSIIYLYVPFVFDYRLIPTSFMNVEVEGIGQGTDSYKEMDNYSPDNYEKLVDNNFE
jgi:hypothetical protein